MASQQCAMEVMGQRLIKEAFWKSRRVFLTGHTGFKGAWLSLWLNKLGADVSGYALAPPTEPSLYNTCKTDELISSIIADIRDGEALTKALLASKPEIIIHMAAQPLVRDSYKDPVETYSTNIMGTVNLLEAVRHCKSVRALVNVTTDKCYENKEWEWGYRENEPMGGYDPYSSSKACSELVTAAYRNSFFNVLNYESHKVAIASARAGNVIGGGDWAKDRLIPDCINALTKGEKILIRNPHAIRPWQHVLEPLGGYLLLAQRLFEEGPEYSEAWNFGPNDSDAKSVEWIVKRMCAMRGDGADYIVESGDHPHEANYLKLDCSKAKARLKWTPRWNLEKALEKIIDWVKAYEKGIEMRDVCLTQIEEYSKDTKEV